MTTEEKAAAYEQCAARADTLGFPTVNDALDAAERVSGYDEQGEDGA